MITININKAKEIVHTARREKRAEEFAPWDIKATIPSEAVQAEVERQKIRTKYAELQIKIDNATTTEELKALIK